MSETTPKALRLRREKRRPSILSCWKWNKRIESLENFQSAQSLQLLEDKEVKGKKIVCVTFLVLTLEIIS